uniref:Uncharacterized protein n=1 Tax=Pyrodinium bahamense TaxID=73915 RepID=A0A6T8XW31_9DINO|mmetsp:Transcript_38200/g.106440  ORF Transcript_38200/g.106440 Transcript_38200/m.106440 type:complete len:265 (+) Transcript_38200:131-925(+)
MQLVPAAALAAAVCAALAAPATAARAGFSGGGSAGPVQSPLRITLGNDAILPVRRMARLGIRARYVLKASVVMNKTQAGSAAASAAAPAAAPEAAPAPYPMAVQPVAPAPAPVRTLEEVVDQAAEKLEETESDKILAKAERANKRAKRQLAEADHLQARAARTIADVRGDGEGMKEAQDDMREAEEDMGVAAEEHKYARREHWEAREDYDEALDHWKALGKILRKEDLKPKHRGSPSVTLMVVAPLLAAICVATIYALRPRLGT